MRCARPVSLTLIPLIQLMLAASLLACGDDPSAPPDAGTVNLGSDQGIDFGTGRLSNPGNFSNSDLYATTNGDGGMKLSTGGENPTNNRPITWYRSGGGIASVFPDLASVPDAPAPTTFDGLIHAKAHNGFLLVTADGDLVAGWLADADAGNVTVQWRRVLPE